MRPISNVSVQTGAIPGPSAHPLPVRTHHVEHAVHAPLNQHRVDLWQPSDLDPDEHIPGRLPFSDFLRRENLIQRAIQPHRALVEQPQPQPQRSEDPRAGGVAGEGESTRRTGPGPGVGVENPDCPCPDEPKARRLREVYWRETPRPGVLVDMVI